MLIEESPERIAERNIRLQKLLLSQEFWILYCLTISFMFFGFYMMSSFKSFGSTKIQDDIFLTLIGSFGALLNAMARFILSSLLDYYTFRQVFGSLICLQLILISIISWSLNFKWFYFVVATLSMACQGSVAAIMPT